MKFIAGSIKLLAFIALIITAAFFLRGHAAAFLNNKALQLYEEGEKQKAFEFLEKSLLINPEAQSYFNLALFYEREKKIDQAIEKYKSAIACDLKYVAAYNALIDIYMMKEQDSLALEVINQLRSQVGDDAIEESLEDWYSKKVSKIFNEGVQFYNNYDYVRAKNKFKEVVAINPSLAQGYYGLGMVAISLKQWQNAIDNLVYAVKLGQKDAVIFNDIGLSYMNLEKYYEAVQYLRQAFLLAPRDIDIAYNLASILRDNGDFKEALSFYQNILREKDDYPNIHNDIGGIYEKMGKREQALAEYAKELSFVEAEIDKGNKTKESLQRKAMAYNGLGKSDQAKEILDQLIRRDPSGRSSYYYRAQVHNKLGMKKKAEADLKKARKLNSDRAGSTVLRKMSRLQKREMLASQKSLNLSTLKENTIIYLKNGRIMRGVLEKETDKKVVLRIKMGHTEGSISFARFKIDRIETID